MTQQAFLIIVGLAVLGAFSNWRHGVLLFLVVGMIQDPFRKSIPGTPGYLSLVTAPVWAVVMLPFLSHFGTLAREFRAGYPGIAHAINLLVVSMIPAAFISATYGSGTWMLTLLGIFQYSCILFGLLIGFYFPRRPDEILRVLAFYCTGTAVALIGTHLETQQLFPSWPAIGSASLGFEWLRDVPDVRISLISGFYRSPDIMGWHAASAAMLAMILALRSRGMGRAMWIAIVCWAAFTTILSGRRKMVMMLPVFLITTVWLHLRRRQGGSNTLPIVGLVVAGIVMIYIQVSPDASYMAYYTYEPMDLFNQLNEHGLEAVLTTIDQHGVFGAGLGVAATGAHHLSVDRPRVWQESGLGKVVVELGLPGLVCFFYFGCSLLWAGWTQVSHRRSATADLSIANGLFAFLIANVGSFLVSGQHFGDPFILCWFSFLIGLLLSVARVPHSLPARHHDPIPRSGVGITARHAPTRGQA